MLSIRPATINDVPLLSTLIHELAEFEHLEHEVSASEDDLARDGFGVRSHFRAVIADSDGQPSGYALFFDFYSTFRGQAGLFLEDLFVRPQFRKRGIGKALFGHVAGIARTENYFCMRWEVLDWNTPAIEFYRDLGAVFRDQWRSAFLMGDSLTAAAGKLR